MPRKPSTPLRHLDLLDSALVRRFEAVLTFPGPTPARAAQLHAMLCTRYAVRLVRDPTATSFDALTKNVLTEARRAAMADWKG